MFYSNVLIVPLGWLTTLCKLSVLTLDIKKITYLHNQTHTQINKVTMCGEFKILNASLSLVGRQSPIYNVH